MLSDSLHGTINRKELLKKAGAGAAAAAASGTLLSQAGAAHAAAAPPPTPVVSNLGKGTKTITIWDGLGGADGAIFAKMLALFVRKNPDVKIHHETLDWGVYYQKVPTSILAGSPPDFIVNDAYGLPQFAARNMLQPLDALIFGQNLLPKNDFSAGELAVGSWQNKVYGIPLWNPIIGFWMNTDLVRKAGLNPDKPPMTGPDFTEWAIRLTTDSHGRHPDQAGFDSRNIQNYGVSMGWYFHSEISNLWQSGGDITNAAHTKCLLDQPESVASLQYWTDLATKYHTHVPISNIYVPATGPLYASNRLAMVVEGSWWLNNFKTVFKSLNYPVTRLYPLPQWGSKQKAVWWTAHVMSIPAGISDQNTQVVARLIAFLSDQASWGSLESGHIPARTSHKKLPAINSNWWTGVLSREQRNFGRLEWYSPNYNQQQTYYMAAWGAALTGTSSPKAALQQATQLINRTLG
ncbi:MAG: extracellular solute-binding protein family 1 [Chloroflexi bacterium]|nr:extracellular solute-binding protein family 1 [Chloroflexota bacterium]